MMINNKQNMLNSDAKILYKTLINVLNDLNFEYDMI